MRDDQRAVRQRIGKKLKRLRLDRGFSQEKLADRAGTNNYKHIGQIERGEVNVGIDTLARLASALSVDVADFVATDKESAERPVSTFDDHELDVIRQALEIINRKKKRE